MSTLLRLKKCLLVYLLIEYGGGNFEPVHRTIRLKGKLPDPFAYHGLAAAYREAGFTEVIRRSATRPIMRYFIK
jgi:hypothetical protein